jgi:hypothetical protein
VLTFCAFWCDTWKTQLPRVAEAQRTLAGLPIQYLTVSVDGRWTDVAKRSSVGTMLSDAGGRWTARMGIDRVPYTLVIAPDGTVRWSAYGTVRTQELVDRLREPAPPSGGTVYLTFDDFPARRGSHELLDALRAAGVSATFFCIGTNAVKMPDLLRRAKREGHSLQVHSWDHDSKNPDLKRCADAIQNLCGTRPTFYRPNPARAPQGAPRVGDPAPRRSRRDGRGAAQNSAEPPVTGVPVWKITVITPFRLWGRCSTDRQAKLDQNFSDKPSS